MKNFSNDPVENVAINALEAFDEFGVRWLAYRHKNKTFIYTKRDQKWQRFVLGGSGNGWGRKCFWTEKGVKEEIIDFLCKAKPELEREFLRAKSELDLTKKTISAL